jgi:hypothetical protein
METINPTEKLELLAASASEIHAASERGKLSSKLRVEFKSDEDRTRKRQLRLLKNRQSAALSRQRKKEYINDLELRTNGLITENHDLLQKITKLTSMNLEYKMHIDALEKRLGEAKSENTELRTRLSSTAGASTSSSTSSAASASSTSSASSATSSEARSTSSDASSSPTPMEEDSQQPQQPQPLQQPSQQNSQQQQQQQRTSQQPPQQNPQQSPPFTTTTTTTITTTTTLHPTTSTNP